MNLTPVELDLEKNPFQYSELPESQQEQANFFSRTITFLKAVTPLEALGLLIAGVVLTIFFPAIAAPFYASGISLLVTRIIWKIGFYFENSFFHELEKRASSFQEKHPYFQLIFFGSSVALSYFISSLGCVAAVAAGVFSGITLQMNHKRKLVSAQREQDNLIEKRNIEALL